MDNKTAIGQLAERLDREPEEVEMMVRMLSETISEAVLEGDSIAIPAFGQFEGKKRMERVSVHPSTGNRILIPPKLQLVFKPSALLKQKVNNAQDEEGGDE